MNDIDIFDKNHPMDKRWDNDQNASLLNIVFEGGTFGNFLKYFIDKFSSLSPDIEETPFTDTGTSHKKIKYSGLIQKYHAHFINDNKDFTGLPVCIILPNTEKDFLYLKTAQWYRGGDRKHLPDDLWSKKIKDLPVLLKEPCNNILNLYKIGDVDSIPKFIVRDWYKLEFLQPLHITHHYRVFDTLKNHLFFKKQKIKHFPLESFFSFELFIKEIKILNKFFSLELDFDRMSEMQSIFEMAYELDRLRQKASLTIKITDMLSAENDIEIPELGVLFEAFIYAFIEKTNPLIQAPLTNYFFKNTKEIKEYLKNYPSWYQRPNPNLIH
jgi:hypothetical protein